VKKLINFDPARPYFRPTREDNVSPSKNIIAWWKFAI